jgi:hypothetical protein
MAPWSVMVRSSSIRWLAVAWLATGCGKELNPEFCAMYPDDDRCAAASGDAATDANVDAVRALRCPASYDVTVDGQTSKYRVVDSPDDWLSAAADCADDGEADMANTHLVVLSTAAELAALDPVISGERHVGHSDLITEGTFIPVTDEVIDFSALETGASPPWAPDEPNGTGNCVMLGDANTLYDRSCTDFDLGYVCECDAYPNDTDNY